MHRKKILIVEDDKAISELMDLTLSDEGYETERAFNGSDAISAFKKTPAQLVVLDINLPDCSGLDVLRTFRKASVDVKAIIVTAHATVKLAVDSMKLGAYDFIEKPFTMEDFSAKVKGVFVQADSASIRDADRAALPIDKKFASLLRNSRKTESLIQKIQVASKGAVTVLLTGESGTGKEIAARYIHFRRQREKPFVAVNCGAIPENLLETELFGHEKGAFTGAVVRKIGKFELAGDGTIFLDEIGDLSPLMQVKLLRALQEHEVERVGGGMPIRIYAKFISATNRDLKQLVKEGRFREDLFYRLNVFPIELPPLRKRREDVPNLLNYFIETRIEPSRHVEFTKRALEKLIQWDWPGNLRELENLAERALLFAGERDLIKEDDIDALQNFASTTSPDSAQSLGDAEKQVLESAIQRFKGNVSEACRFLKISRDTFYRKAKKHTIRLPR